MRRRPDSRRRDRQGRRTGPRWERPERRVRRPLWKRPERRGHDDGRALIEVVFLAVLLLVPTVYILIGVVRLQAGTLAVSQAARDVGRLIETAPMLPDLADATAVAAVDLGDQGINADNLRIVTVPVGADCDTGTATAFSRRPGADYDVCVTATVSLPGVPTALAGSRNTVTGVYTVHIDELREGR